jgi:hypothetical protein
MNQTAVEPDVDHDTDQLAVMLRHKHQVLARLAAVARRQLELIEAGDWAGLMQELSAKSRLVDALCEVERSLNPYRVDDPERRTWPDAAVHHECRRLTAECGQMLTEIVHMEKESEALLVRRRDEARSRLQGMHTAATAQAAYLSIENITAGSLDLSSETA